MKQEVITLEVKVKIEYGRGATRSDAIKMAEELVLLSSFGQLGLSVFPQSAALKKQKKGGVK